MRWLLPALLCLVQVASAQESSSSAELAKEALAARDAGQTKHSIELYRLALTLDPTDTESWWYQGLNYYDLDRYSDCQAAFGKVTEQMPDNGGAFAFLGLCEYQTGSYETAFAHLVVAQQKGIQPGTELANIVRYHYIALTNKIGQFELASGLLNEVVADSSVNLPNVAKLVGLSMLRLKLTPEEIPAEQEKQVLAAGRAVILAWRRRLPEAMKEADALLAKYPKLPNAHYLKAYLFLQEHSDEAIPEFEKELKVSPEHVQARLQIAYEYLQRGEAEKGLPYAEQAVAIAPTDFTAHNIYGRLLLDLGKIDLAVTHLEKAVELAPTSPEAHFQLAAALSRAGRKEEAAKHRKIFVDLEKVRRAERGSILPQQKRR